MRRRQAVLQQQAANHAKPCAGVDEVVGGFGVRKIFRLKWYPQRGRNTAHRVTVKARWRDAHDFEIEALESEVGIHHREIAPKVLLPGSIAHHSHWGRVPGRQRM